MKLRRVMERGRIVFNGRVFHHNDLIKLVSQYVLVMGDESIGEADCIVFDADTHEFICNAQNDRRWAEIVRRIDAEIA